MEICVFDAIRNLNQMVPYSWDNETGPYWHIASVETLLSMRAFPGNLILMRVLLSAAEMQFCVVVHM